MEPPAAIVLHWNQIWAVMEAWDRVSDSSAMRERLMAADPPPKRARLAANAVTASTTATPDTFDFTPSEIASPRSVPHATRSPRIFSFSKLQAHTGAAIEALSEAASPQLSVPHVHSFARPVTGSTAARSPRIFRFSKPRVHADGATEAPSETASPQPAVTAVPRAAQSPRIFSFSKPRAHAGPAFANGDVACVHGLNGRPDLNGQHCVLTAFHDDAARWAVRFMSGEEVRVKPANLKPSPATAGTLATEVPGATASPLPSVPHAAQSPRIFSFSKPRAHADGGATGAPNGAGSKRARDAATVFSFTSAPTQAPVQHGRGPSPRIYSFAQPRIVAPPACAEPFRFSATTTLAPVPGPAFTFSVPPPKMVPKKVSRRQLRLAASYDWSIGQV